MIIELNSHDSLNRQLKTKASVKVANERYQTMAPNVIRIGKGLWYRTSDGVDQQGFCASRPQYSKLDSVPRAKIVGKPVPHEWADFDEDKKRKPRRMA